MKPRSFNFVINVSLLLAVLLAIPLAGQEIRFTVRDLGTLGGGSSQGFGPNNRGDVAGSSALPGDTETHAFLYRDGVMLDLGTLGGPFSFAQNPPNDKGNVAGGSLTSAFDLMPFIWSKGVMSQLPTLGSNFGVANQINNRGEASGFAGTSDPDPTCDISQNHFVPVIWQHGVITERLTLLAGDQNGIGVTINNRGQVAGWSGNCGTPSHAVLWHQGAITPLGSLGGGFNLPLYINNQGQIVGIASLPGETTVHAFLWENGVMNDLGTLPGDFASEGSAINSRGQVVGDSIGTVQRAFLWENGIMADLNSMIPDDSPLFLQVGTGINEKGEIAGWGLEESSGEVHAFLATPVHGEAAATVSLSQSPQAGRKLKGKIPPHARIVLHQRFSRFLEKGLRQPQ